jgi:hypothetical protein
VETASWTDKLSKGAVKGMTNLEQGFHAMGPGSLQGKFMGMHRSRQMIGMTTGWIVCNYIGNVMAGQDLDHHPIKKEDVAYSLRFLHNTMHYNAFSDDPHDRALQAVHQLMGGIGGGVGAVMGSDSFFENNGTAARLEGILAKDAKNFHLLDADFAASNAQAGLWKPFAAAMGAFSSASGLAMVMWLNFSTGINSVFNMRGNRKVGTDLFTLPYLKEISNTASPHPFGPSELLPKMAKYYADLGKLSADVTTTPEGKAYVKGLLKPLFPKLTEAQETAVLECIAQVRKDALDGKKDVQQAITKQFTGVNFENLLKESGIDPLEAQLGNHGMLTRVARSFSRFMKDAFGVDKGMHEVEARFQEGYRQRHPDTGASR